MDVPTAFFSKLRGQALTLEKEVAQLVQALRGEDADSEDESPVRVLHDLHCEVKTLKDAVNASLDTSCSKKQAIHDFMKASELLMQRNAADLGKIRELFQKYGYKPHAKDSTEEEEEVNNESTVSVQNKSDEEKAKDVLHLPTSTEKPPLPKNPLCDPQLSDFGLSQYAFSRPWSAVKTQQTTNAHQQKSKNETPLKMQTPRTLPKTPKCRLKMDDYECVTPKLEHFGISEHTMCMNEDYTMSLMHKTPQTMKKLVKKGDNGGNVPEMTPKETMVTSVSKSNVRAKNAADWMASPMEFMFCTPNVKVSSKKNSKVLSRSPGTKKLPLPGRIRTPQHPDFRTRSPETKEELPLPSHTVTPQHPDFQTRSPEMKELPLPSYTATPQFPDFQTRWLKTEAKEEVKLGEKTESVTKNGAKDKQYKESSIPFAVSPDDYLKHLGDPSPPIIKHYDQLLDTPPPPEITRIPDDVLQILSKYNHKVDSSKAKEMETKAGSITRYESDSTDYCNKENRGYHGVFKPNI